MSRIAFVCLVAAAALLLILANGCGSNSSTSNNLSATQAQAVSQQISQALVLGLDGAFGAADSHAPQEDRPRPSLAAVVGNVHPDSITGCTTTSSGTSCNIPVSASEPCPGGGTVAMSGDIAGTISNSGTGSLTANLQITPTQCSVSNLVINGNPDVVVDSQFSFTDAGPVYPLTFSEAGDITYGPNPSGSCQINVNYTINSITSCTATGSVCGQPVSGSC